MEKIEEVNKKISFIVSPGLEMELKGLEIQLFPTFLLRYKRERKIAIEQIKGIINDLREKDFYAFSKEVEEGLLQTFLSKRKLYQRNQYFFLLAQVFFFPKKEKVL